MKTMEQLLLLLRPRSTMHSTHYSLRSRRRRRWVWRTHPHTYCTERTVIWTRGKVLWQSCSLISPVPLTPSSPSDWETSSCRWVWTAAWYAGSQTIDGEATRNCQTEGLLLWHCGQHHRRSRELCSHQFWLLLQHGVMSYAEVFRRHCSCGLHREWARGWVQEPGGCLCAMALTQPSATEHLKDQRNGCGLQEDKTTFAASLCWRRQGGGGHHIQIPGNTQDNKLDWSANTDALYKKGQSALLPEETAALQCLQKAPPDVLPVCHCQYLVYAVVCWGGWKGKPALLLDWSWTFQHESLSVSSITLLCLLSSLQAILVRIYPCWHLKLIPFNLPFCCSIDLFLILEIVFLF